MNGESRVAFYVSRFTFHVARARPFLADGALLVVALIWGATFVMVKDAVTTYPVLSFLALRFAFAALALLPLMLLRRPRSPADRAGTASVNPFSVILSGSARNVPQYSRDSEESHPTRHGDSSLEDSRRERPSANPLRVTPGGLPATPAGFVFTAPLLMGLALFAGYALQTFGLKLTTPAKAGFITGLSVVIVPVVSTVLLHQRLSRGVWLGVGLATVGLALLSLQADLSVNPGDVLVLGCALAFACQILLTGRFAPSYDPLLLTFGQIVVVALLAGIAALALESLPMPPAKVLFAAAFTGILATSLAFGIQTMAQRFTSATRTALVFASEPVFAALFSFLLIGEVLGLRQVVGCASILAGMIIAELLRNHSSAQ